MSILLKEMLKILPASCVVIYCGTILIGCAWANKKYDLDMNPIDIMLHREKEQTLQSLFFCLMVRLF